MIASPAARAGGQILIDQLRVHGVDRVFCVPGESYLAALHDVRDEIAVVVCRQEGGAAYMAEACGKLTGKTGVCFVTRGPGATNASVGLHRANIIILVINKGMYGTIRMHQERAYPGRVSGTMLTNPDFAALARSYGARARGRISSPRQGWPSAESRTGKVSILKA